MAFQEIQDMITWSAVTSFVGVDTILVGALVFLCGVKLLQSWPIKRTKSSDTETLPGPRGVPVLGYLPFLNADRPFDTFTQLRKKYGDIFQIRMGSMPVVVVNGKRALRECLVRHSEAFAGRPAFKSFQAHCKGESLAFADISPKWRLHHKLCAQGMGEMIRHKENIESVMNSVIARAVLGVVSRGSKPVDPHSVFRTLAFDIATTMCFGRNSTTAEDEMCKKVKEKLDELVALRKKVQSADIMPWTQRFVQRDFDKFGQLLVDYENLMQEKTEKVLNDTEDHSLCAVRALNLIGKNNSEVMGEVGLSHYRLLQSTQDIIAAGADTVGNLPNWLVLYMIHFPEVQRRIQEEIDIVLGSKSNSSRPPNGADLIQMPYTEAVITEVARHVGIVPLSIPHKTTKDVTIDNYLIKKDTMVFANIYSAAHDLDTWEDPEKFNPDRFLTEEGTMNRSLAENWPMFGYGKRRCLGEKYGRLETFLIVVSFLKRFSVRAVPGQELPPLGKGRMDINIEPEPCEIIFEDRFARSSKSG